MDGNFGLTAMFIWI